MSPFTQTDTPRRQPTCLAFHSNLGQTVDLLFNPFFNPFCLLIYSTPQARSCCQSHFNHKMAQTDPHQAKQRNSLWFGLSVMLLNVTSLSNEMDKLHTTVRSVKTGLVITVYKQIGPHICYMIMNYSNIYAPNGGGVVLFFHKELHPSRLNVDNHESVEVMWIRTVLVIHPCQTVHYPSCLSSTSTPSQSYTGEPSH